MKKTISIFSMLSLILGISCFLFIIYMGWPGIQPKYFFNIIFQLKPVILIPITLCVFIIFIDIWIMIAKKKKEKIHS